jgi:hypothetical protein
MDITLREEYWIKFCMKLIAVISHNNYYSQFYHPSCELVLIRQDFLIPNGINELMNLRM